MRHLSMVGIAASAVLAAHHRAPRVDQSPQYPTIAAPIGAAIRPSPLAGGDDTTPNKARRSRATENE